MKKIKIIFILILLIFGGFIYFYKTPFKSKIWLRIDSLTHGLRLDMVDDLMENHLKKGMHYNEFTKLIGKDYKKLNEKGNILSFELYEHFGWNIDHIGYTYLDLEIDKDSLLINVDLRKVKYNKTSDIDMNDFFEENKKVE